MASIKRIYYGSPNKKSSKFEGPRPLTRTQYNEILSRAADRLQKKLKNNEDRPVLVHRTVEMLPEKVDYGNPKQKLQFITSLGLCPNPKEEKNHPPFLTLRRMSRSLYNVFERRLEKLKPEVLERRKKEAERLKAQLRIERERRSILSTNNNNSENKLRSSAQNQNNFSNDQVIQIGGKSFMNFRPLPPPHHLNHPSQSSHSRNNRQRSNGSFKNNLIHSQSNSNAKIQKSRSHQNQRQNNRPGQRNGKVPYDDPNVRAYQKRMAMYQEYMRTQFGVQTKTKKPTYFNNTKDVVIEETNEKDDDEIEVIYENVSIQKDITFQNSTSETSLDKFNHSLSLSTLSSINYSVCETEESEEAGEGDTGNELNAFYQNSWMNPNSSIMDLLGKNCGDDLIVIEDDYPTNTIILA